MRNLVLLFMSLWLGISIAYSSEGISGAISTDDQSLKRSQLDIYVVSIVDVENQNTTNANPPTGHMIVDEVLRGNNRNVVSSNYKFQMVPVQMQRDFEDGSKLNQEWHTRTFQGPVAGGKYIVFVYKWEKTKTKFDTMYLLHPVVEYSDYNGSVMLNNMVRAERQPWMQSSLFWLMLLLPFLSYCTYSCWQKNVFSKSITLSLPVIAILLYPVYESGLPTNAKIRIDLFFIIPFIVLNLILVLRYCWIFFIKGNSPTRH